MQYDNTELPEDWDFLTLAAEKLKEIAGEYPAKWQKDMIDASCELNRLAAFVEAEAGGTQPCLSVSQPRCEGLGLPGLCPIQGGVVVAFESGCEAPESLSEDPCMKAEPFKQNGGNS